MISTKITKDLSYIASVVSTPGMQALCSGGLPIGNIEEIVGNPSNLYVEVDNGSSRVGFVSFFKLLEDDAAEIHVALKTRGEDTVNAIRQSIAIAKDDGIKNIYAIYPFGKKSLDRLCDLLDFSTLSPYNHENSIFSVRKLTA